MTIRSSAGRPRRPYLFLTVAALTASLPLFCQDQSPWRDPGQPVGRRVDDLLSRMTLEEKVRS